MSNIDKLRDKVAKLLRQAEDVVGTPEEAVFQAKAFELMAKYGISEAAVDAAKEGLDSSDLREAIKWQVDIVGKYAAAQMQLLHQITLGLHGKAIYTKRRDGSLVMSVYAVPTHLDRIKMLWQILQPQMMRLVDKVRPDYDISGVKRVYDYTTHTFTYKKTTGAGELKSYRRSWIAGFASAVGARLREQETKALEADTGSALVLFKGDAQRAEVALRNEHRSIRHTKGPRVNANGYAHGQRDGRTATFNHSLT